VHFWKFVRVAVLYEWCGLCEYFSCHFHVLVSSDLLISRDHGKAKIEK